MRTPQEIIGEDRYLQLVFEGFAVIPAEPTPEAVGAWWRCKNSGGSDYDAYRALVSAWQDLQNSRKT